MDRFNIPEDVPIESKMVTRQIRSAQTQIEAQNAEIRKDVLKYDEVLNKQRQVIYAERRRVLDGEDLHEQVDAHDRRHGRAPTSSAPPPAGTPRTGTSTSSGPASSSCTRSGSPSRRSRRRSATTATRWTPSSSPTGSPRTPARRTSGARRSSARPSCASSSGRCCCRSSTASGASTCTRWTTCARASALRAYAQRDPLVEYQREGFDMFTQMMEGVKEEAVGFLFNFQPEPAPEPEVATAPVLLSGKGLEPGHPAPPAGAALLRAEHRRRGRCRRPGPGAGRRPDADRTRVARRSTRQPPYRRRVPVRLAGHPGCRGPGRRGQSGPADAPSAPAGSASAARPASGSAAGPVDAPRAGSADRRVGDRQRPPRQRGRHGRAGQLARRAGGEPPPGARPGNRQRAVAQRPLPVRVRQEVQALPRRPQRLTSDAQLARSWDLAVAMATIGPRRQRSVAGRVAGEVPGLAGSAAAGAAAPAEPLHALASCRRGRRWTQRHRLRSDGRSGGLRGGAVR